jgi:hypothetical protein
VASPGPGCHLVDFGRVAFGNLILHPPPGARGDVVVHLGEALADGRVDRAPPGTVRYARSAVELAGDSPCLIAPPPAPRHADPAAVHTPAAWGALLPFRWVEIEGWPEVYPPPRLVRRAAWEKDWDDNAASFTCSDPLLDRVWELCRYSIKATTFAGIYVDGERERIAYEGDAYLNQVAHLACTGNPAMGRATFDHLLRHPTWPTEWASHLVFMAFADWMHTGDRDALAARFDALPDKLLLERIGPDGLVRSTPAHREKGDLVDWPPCERDGYVFTEINTVVNAFHLASLKAMAELAAALGRMDEAHRYAAQAGHGMRKFHHVFFDPARGVYRDGADTDHAAQHASLFPLALGLVPPAQRAAVTARVAARGMAGSVYAACYLLDALFTHGRAADALALITAPGDRSWRYMLEQGATITWEAWNERVKPNLDWTHAWGAAPAALLPRHVLGVRPAAPGWSEVALMPRPGPLAAASGTVPTPRGPVAVAWRFGAEVEGDVQLPPGMVGRIDLPGRVDVVRGGFAVAGERRPRVHGQARIRWYPPRAPTGHPGVHKRAPEGTG